MLRRVGPLTLAVALAFATAMEGTARADPVVAPSSGPGAASDADPYDTFPLVTPHEKHYLRAGLEVGGVLAVGLVDYMLNTSARGGTLRSGDIRWGIHYDWPTLREKLIGTGLNLDTNKFPTNYASHPFAGTLYYTVARSNHLSFAESFLYAVLGSTTWEYFGEIREITSVNDLLVTPVSGAAIGEAMMQLSGFFQHGDKTFANGALSFLASPVNAVNGWTEDTEPLRATRTDALGFPADTWHRFVARAGVGATVQEAGDRAHPRATYLDERVGLDLALAHLPGYRGAGKEARLYDDGNVSDVTVQLAQSQGRLVDALFATRVVPVGLYVRDARGGDGGPVGYGAFVGLRIGFEYGTHAYDRDGLRPRDIVAIVSPLGLAAEYAYTRGAFTLRTSLDLGGAIAGVTPYALADYLARHTADGLLSPVRQQGYYHAVEITAAPAVEVAWGGVSVRTELRLDSFRAIEGIDEQEGPLVDDSIRLADRRAIARGALAWVPGDSGLRVAAEVERRVREGEVGDAHASRSETSAVGTLGVLF